MNAVLFDMDGVVVDSEHYWPELEEGEIFPEVVGPDRLSAAEITGMNVEDQYEYLAERFELEVAKDEFLGLYDDAARDLYTDKVTLMAEFESLLTSIRLATDHVALVSSSPERWIELVLDRFELHDAFDEVVSADHISTQSKPSPDIYLHTASLLNVEPTECVAVEDSVHGIRAATDAGMYCLGYRTAANEGHDLSAADCVVEGANELRTELAALLGSGAENE